MSSITFECHVCHATLKVAADKAGKKAKCKCGTVVTIPSANKASPSAIQRSSRSKSADDDEPRRRRDETDDDFDEDRPRRRRDEDDDFDDEDRPRKRRRADEDDDDRPRRKRRSDEDDDFDDGDRPRRRRDEDDDLDDDRPRKRRRRDDEDDDRPRRKGGGWRDLWPRVRLGFMLAFIGAIVYTAAYALIQLTIIIGGIIAFSGNFNMGLFNTLSIIKKIAALVLMAGVITGIVGYVFWLFVTNKNGKLGFAIATLANAAVFVILFLIFTVIPSFTERTFQGDSTTMDVVLHILQTAFLTATWILAAFYVKAVARSLKDRDLGDKFTLLLIMASVAGGVMMLCDNWSAFAPPLLLLPFRPTSIDGARTTMMIRLVLLAIATGVHIFQMVLFILAFNSARETTDVR